MKNRLTFMRLAWFVGLTLLLAARPVAAQYLTDVATANPDYATPPPRPTVLLETKHLTLTRFPTDTPTRLKLLFANDTRTDLTISIRSSRHTVLYEGSKAGRVTGGWVIFDLSDLPEGQYSILIRAGGEQAERTFNVGFPRPVVVQHGLDLAFD